MIEPQYGATYDDQLRLARHAEELGFDGFVRSDHYDTTSGDSLPGPTDAWVTLGALAVQTKRLRLGTMVSSATFRLPGPLAISVAQVDEMSGGRVEFGVGTGWFEREHLSYGIPFPDLGERFDRFEEQLEIITGLWTTPIGHRYDYDGRYYRLVDSPALPKPRQQPHPPIVIGGHGRRRTPALAARFADEFNVPFATIDVTRDCFDALRTACEAAQRDLTQRPLRLSVAQTIACGRDDVEAERRAAAIGRTPPVFGTPAQVVDQIGRFAELGATRMYLQILDLSDLAQLDLIASEVMPQVG